MANEDSTSGTVNTGGTPVGTESGLASYAGPYVTEMLGRGAALADQPYTAYGGPLTAGESAAQTQAFQGVANLAVPTQEMGAFQPQQFTAETAQQYMNPYLQSALDPQLMEARRQAQIQRVQDAARLTGAGAFGGSRQAIMESELNRNLLQNLAGITGQGYAAAYDKAMQQFNVEQQQQQAAQDAANAYGLAALTKQAELGAQQRAIESEGITADRMQFEEERDFPYRQVQYMQSLLQGLPVGAASYSYSEPSALAEAMGTSGGIMSILNNIFGIDDANKESS